MDVFLGTQTALAKYGHEEEGEQILAWEGFLQMYETTYAKNKKSLKKEFEKRGNVFITFLDVSRQLLESFVLNSVKITLRFFCEVLRYIK